MKKELLIGLLLINSFVFANTNNTSLPDKTLFSTTNNIYTCTYEYYEEIFDEAGNLIYVFLYSEQVECNEDEAGETYAYTYNEKTSKRKRINVESTLSVAR